MRSALLHSLALAVAVLIPGLCSASVATVPDDYATIQAAIDIGADTVLIREGSYTEVPNANRGVVLHGIGERRPQLAGLVISNPYSFVSRRWDVSAIDITGQVDISTFNIDLRNIEISFADCTLRGGLQHVINEDSNDIASLNLLRCNLGAPCAARASAIVMAFDTVDAGVRWNTPNADPVFVQKCWFRGWSGPALYINGEDGATGGRIEDNVMEDCAVGIYGIGLDRMNIASNTIRRMIGAGMDLDGSSIVRGNIIEGCGVGISSYPDAMWLFNNTVLHSRGSGLWFGLPFNLRLEGNVVGFSEGPAVSVLGSNQASLSFIGNTLFKNSESGLDFPQSVNNSVVIQNNIGFANGGWGVRVSESQQSIALGCNDWFANGLGAVTGVAAGATDLAVDPGFCDVASDSVGLYSDSPLLGQSACGQIGARGVECSPPALGGLGVASSHAGIRVEWNFHALPPAPSWIERADQLFGPWDSLGTGGSIAATYFELLDAAVAPNHEYYYRVAWKDRGAIVRGSPAMGTWTDAGQLRSVTPNPAHGEATIEWVLSHAGTTDIRVFDLSGREVATVARAMYGVGRHQAQWDGRWVGRGAAPAGMYVVRISSADGTSNHRVLLLR